MRRTKQEAQETRSRILDAAERLFQLRGVSATSLHDIAEGAGVTRGAVYWHFRNKGDLFEAMLARVCLPIEAASSGSLDRRDGTPPLARLREHLAALLACIAGDEQTQRVFDIVTTCVEYVDEMRALRERQAASSRGHLARLQSVFEEARRAGDVAADPQPRILALGLFALTDGLIRNWVIDPSAFDLVGDGMRAVDAHLAGACFTPDAGTAFVESPPMETPGNLFCVAAPSGAGKSTLVKALLELDARLAVSVSHTTRLPRGQEVHGREYWFVEPPTFDAMVERGDFFEHAQVHGNLYGTSRKAIEERLVGGDDVVLEIDWQGALQIKRIFTHAVLIFILPPSWNELAQRLSRRGEDTPDVIATRLANARHEVAQARHFDFVIINSLFETALFDLKTVVHSQRLKYAAQARNRSHVFAALGLV